MVSRIIAQKKTQKTKISNVSRNLIDHKFMGDEPIVVDASNPANMTKAYNWYNYHYDEEKSREWLLEYLKTSSRSKQEIANVRRADKNAIPTTVGWIARIRSNGNPTYNDDYFNSRLSPFLSVNEIESIPNRLVISIQDRTKAKNNELITLIESELDSSDNFSLYDFLKAQEATPSAATAVKQFYSPKLNELFEDCEQIREAFGKKLKGEQTFWQRFVEDCDRFIGNTKAAKVRKPREKKAKSAVDQVKLVKYQKEFPSLKLQSVNPAEMIGAKQIWMFNTKTKKLIKYDALSVSGFAIKGTTLQSIDIETSSMKTIRKPEMVLKELFAAGKVGLRKFMDDIKTTSSVPTGRINEDTIILKVIK